MSSLFESAMSYLSKALGLESVSSFPARHVFAHTNWDPSYFDIPYGTTPEEIERRICVAIGNTPTIFGRINNPTPRMQRALINVIAERVRRNDRSVGDLVTQLIDAYESRLVHESIPGLRAEIEATGYEEPSMRARRVLAFLSNERIGLNVIDLVH
jgi:hypothetical protein